MNESTKSRELRQARGDFDLYLRGEGIDIGAGDDALAVPNGNVRGWDVKDGDAQLMNGVADGSYDFVYSSHCLEHMRDVRESLANWTRILKPGGFLYIVVPDYVLYEKLIWPSAFNRDHKQSFSTLIERKQVGRDNHFHTEQDLFPLMRSLGLEILRLTTEDAGFNYNFGVADQTRLGALAQLCVVAKKQ